MDTTYYTPLQVCCRVLNEFMENKSQFNKLLFEQKNGFLSISWENTTVNLIDCGADGTFSEISQSVKNCSKFSLEQKNFLQDLIRIVKKQFLEQSDRL